MDAVQSLPGIWVDVGFGVLVGKGIKVTVPTGNGVLVGVAVAVLVGVGVNGCNVGTTLDSKPKPPEPPPEAPKSTALALLIST